MREFRPRANSLFKRERGSQNERSSHGLLTLPELVLQGVCRHLCDDGDALAWSLTCKALNGVRAGAGIELRTQLSRVCSTGAHYAWLRDLYQGWTAPGSFPISEALHAAAGCDGIGFVSAAWDERGDPGPGRGDGSRMRLAHVMHDVVPAAAEAGHQGLVAWALERLGDEAPLSVCCEAAAKGGHIPLLRYLKDQHGATWDEDTALAAASGGHFECLKVLVDGGCRPCMEKAASLGAAAGSWEVISYVADAATATISADPRHRVPDAEILRGAGKEYLSISWGLDALDPTWIENAATAAARKGNVEVLEKILDHARGGGRWGFKISAPEDWGPRVCSAAAKGGSLACLKLLRAAGCRWSTIVCANAAGEGHWELFSWARSQGAEWDERAPTYAAVNGQLKMLKRIIEEGCPYDEGVSLAAAEWQHAEVMEHVADKGLPVHDRAMRVAMRKDSVEVLMSLHRAGQVAPGVMMFTGLAHRGHLHMLRHMVGKGNLGEYGDIVRGIMEWGTGVMGGPGPSAPESVLRALPTPKLGFRVPRGKEAPWAVLVNFVRKSRTGELPSPEDAPPQGWDKRQVRKLEELLLDCAVRMASEWKDVRPWGLVGPAHDPGRDFICGALRHQDSEVLQMVEAVLGAEAGAYARAMAILQQQALSISWVYHDVSPVKCIQDLEPLISEVREQSAEERRKTGCPGCRLIGEGGSCWHIPSSAR